MAPSTTIGATILLCRKAATKVIVCHSPQGARPINSTPRGPRPQSRTILVVTAVSSINTSRAGSSIPCSRIQRRRARATSARCCSAVRRLFFFEGDVVSLEKPRDRALTGPNPPLKQFRNGLLQGQNRLLGHQSQYLFGMLFQRRNASSARLRRATPALHPALQPSHRRTRINTKTFSRLPPRRSCFHCFNHTLAQVGRIGLRHCSPPQRRINAEESLTSNPMGIPPIQIGRETLLAEAGTGIRCQSAYLARRYTVSLLPPRTGSAE